MTKSALDSHLAADRSVVNSAPRIRRIWIVASLAWLLCVGVYCYWMTEYGLRVNDNNLQRNVATWPSDTSLPRDAQAPTLVLFLHPMCSCSEATVEELNRIVATASNHHNSAAPKTLIVASMPADKISQWSDSRLIRQAAQLPNSTLLPDLDGIECDRFGVNTSGTVMLFDTSGHRLFCGGVTIARGQAGESLGGDSLTKLLSNVDLASNAPDGRTPRLASPAFGCKLLSPNGPQIVASSALLAKEISE
ncbi:hypothetical protein [Rosistilla oblonga]|uniref:hypothetical protein n=1 Tax=Rosistilla oblonga TaxID=2527990 RepID=UPI003A96B547